MFIFVTKQ